MIDKIQIQPQHVELLKHFKRVPGMFVQPVTPETVESFLRGYFMYFTIPEDTRKRVYRKHKLKNGSVTELGQLKHNLKLDDETIVKELMDIHIDYLTEELEFNK